MKNRKFEISEWEELKKEIAEFIESQKIQSSDFTKSFLNIDKKIKNAKKNKSFDMKKMFEHEHYSSPEYYEDYLMDLSSQKHLEMQNRVKLFEKFNTMIIECESITPRMTTNGGMPKIDYKLSDDWLHEFLSREFPWATDVISDMIDLKQLMSYNRYLGSSDTMLFKMMFKEMFSMIDKLRTELGLELSRKVLGGKRSDRHFETKKLVKEWYKFMPQDYLLNGNPRYLDSRPYYYDKFDVDDEGWINFSYKLIDLPVSPNKNNFYKMIKMVRNNFEHSYVTDFAQGYIDIGVISPMIPLRNQREEICNYFYIMFVDTAMIFFYELIKFDANYNDELRMYN